MAEIKPELNFGLDNFGKQKTLTKAQTVAQMLINLLLMKPGQIPSLPHIGINIKQYLYKFKEDIDLSFIKNQIAEQCVSIVPYIDMNNMKLLVVPYEKESILYIYAPLSVLVEEEALIIGFKRVDGSNDVTFNYKTTNAISA